MKPVWIFGAGGHAKVVIDALRAEGAFRIVGVLDDDPGLLGRDVLGVPVRGMISIESCERFGIEHAVIAIGANRARREVASRFEGRLSWARVAHPRAYLATGVRVGPGTVVFAGAVVQPDAIVGRHAIINTASSVDHDGTVGDFAHVGPGARLGGEVTIGAGALIGIGSCVRPRIKIGEWATLGAGGVAVNDIPAGRVVKGVPAR